MSQIITHMDSIAGQYKAVFCDLWGVLHNGREVYPEAVAALQAFRAGGGRVVLLTNAPRPYPGVHEHLAGLGAPRDCYDLVVTSGDASQDAIAAGLYGSKVYHVGPDRDHLFFDDHKGNPLPVSRVPIAQADSIVCTGLWDDQTETPEDYRHLIADGINRGLTMLCANPDIQVDRGTQRIYCAGAIAAAYTAAGGETHYYGKPHSPIYQLSRNLLAERFGLVVEQSDTLAIGDGILTDVPGAMAEGIDCLFVAGGLGADEIGLTDGQPDPAGLNAYLSKASLSPRYSIGYLR